MLKQQIPNHQLHKISHKTSLSLNNNHKAHPPLNNNRKAKQPLILNRDLSHHNSAMIMNFQMHLPLPQRLLRRNILDLYKRNQNIVYNQKHSTFNPLYLCFYFFFTDQERKTRSYYKNSCITTQVPSAPKFFRFTIYQKLCTRLKYISLLFSVPIKRSTNSIFFFLPVHIY